MTTELLVQISPEGKLEIPPEVQNRFKPGDKYLISLTEDSITLKKVHEDKVNLEQFFERLETMKPDPHPINQVWLRLARWLKKLVVADARTHESRSRC